MGLPSDPSTVRESGVLSEAAVAALTERLEQPTEGLDADIGLGEFAARTLGPEVADRLVDPAGDKLR